LGCCCGAMWDAWRTVKLCRQMKKAGLHSRAARLAAPAASSSAPACCVSCRESLPPPAHLPHNQLGELRVTQSSWPALAPVLARPHSIAYPLASPRALLCTLSELRVPSCKHCKLKLLTSTESIRNQADRRLTYCLAEPALPQQDLPWLLRIAPAHTEPFHVETATRIAQNCTHRSFRDRGWQL
jgi:hypothetical protein